ncbi:MAG TPA: histidine phosphatase family protein [Candidatus Pristimantibacillus sp.]|nr:histidine phosphatase family protein [Candidatus Pristimantibacillus sp.]
MPQIVVIRHAEAVANAKGILMGCSFDSPLSERGQAAARAKGEKLCQGLIKPQKIYTSELTRAKQTAQIIRGVLGEDVEIVELAGLNERSFGEYEGQPYRFVLEAFEKNGDNPPTIEPVAEFVERVLKTWETIKQEAKENTFVVTHSNPLAVIRCALYHPDKLQRFWDYEDDEHLEGLTYSY